MIGYNNYNCKVEIGGNDQWSNIIGGVELVRKFNHADAYAFTNREDITLQDFSNELKALKEKFNIRELYQGGESNIFKTKQLSDLVFVLKKIFQDMSWEIFYKNREFQDSVK